MIIGSHIKYNRLNQIILAAFVALSSHFSFAEVGPDRLMNQISSDSICRIMMEDEKGFGICSGALIDKNKVLTAAHCFDHVSAQSEITIECGYKGIDSNNIEMARSKGGNLTYKKGIIFKEKAKAKTYVMHPLWGRDENFDQAVITLDRSLNATPIQFKSTLSGHQPLDVPSVCYSAGYGVNKDITMGTLNIGQINSENLVKNSYEYFETSFYSKLTNPDEEDPLLTEPQTFLRYALRDTMDSSVMVYGDSGGPVFCRFGNQSEDQATVKDSKVLDNSYFIVGVNRALYYGRVKEANNIFKIEYTSGLSRADGDFIQEQLNK